MGTSAGPLLGRSAELSSIDAALDQLRERRPCVLAIVGEPGIGKTRLLSELAARADARGSIVLRGGASEFERELPFWIFVDALDAYAHALPPERLADLDNGSRTELGWVLPTMGTPNTSAGARGDARLRTHSAVRALLENLSREKPLVLDDVHWADSGSIKLLGAILRRPPGPIMLNRQQVTETGRRSPSSLRQARPSRPVAPLGRRTGSRLCGACCPPTRRLRTVEQGRRRLVPVAALAEYVNSLDGAA
jgi:predicted ATPase